ncbi:DNA-directed RNA polymerase subunit omega [Flavobacteriaceae bacterium]|nr:DNA-directed RNA polymerase subunit omega [Flavobacteriaceae bacterium]
MARVTTEDCLLVVPNRFDLCLLANQRAKKILSGAQTTLNEKEKPTVLALREIASKLVSTEELAKSIVNNNNGINAIEEKQEQIDFAEYTESKNNEEYNEEDQVNYE